MSEMTDRFRELHTSGTFLMPNPWDLGTARFLESLGFSALATTSWGLAAALGRLDQTVTRDEMLAHTEALVGAIDVPLNIDSERCYSEDLAGITETVRLLGDAGAAGCSIEDYDPATKTIDPIEKATERVAAAAEGARKSGLDADRPGRERVLRRPATSTTPLPGSVRTGMRGRKLFTHRDWWTATRSPGLSPKPGYPSTCWPDQTDRRSPSCQNWESDGSQPGVPSPGRRSNC